MDDYEAARAALVEIAQAKGYATTPPPKPRPKPVPPRKLCPVGCCHPPTFKPVEVSKAGDFCRRHTGKLSHPLARQLGVARKHGDKTEIDKVLAQALIEARAHDELWRPFAISASGRAEGCDSWREAVLRYFRLFESGDDPVMLSGKTGAVISIDEVRAYCPHTVIDANGEVLGPLPADGDRPRAMSPLAWAVGRAHARCWAEDEQRLVWPTGRPTVVNGWTGEELDLKSACTIMAKGHRC